MDATAIRWMEKLLRFAMTFMAMLLAALDYISWNTSSMRKKYGKVNIKDAFQDARMGLGLMKDTRLQVFEEAAKMLELTKEQQEAIEATERNAKSLGLEVVVRGITTKVIELDESKYIKVNLPDSLEKFSTGNGEGIWAVPYLPEDHEACEANVRDTTFNVIVLNDCLSYPFRYGTIINVKIGNPEHRPVLTYDWMDEIIKTASKGEMSLATMLSGGDEVEEEK